MRILIIGLTIASSFLFLSCAQGYQEDSNSNQNPNRPEVPTQAAPISSNSGVQHYICPNNCAGSGGATEGVCPTCGTAYLHNQAFHDQPQMQQPAAPVTGVQHYICPNNCAGSGGATEGVCPTCGTAYLHNQEFHNQPNNGLGSVAPSTPNQTNQAISPVFQNQSGQVSGSNINTPSALSVGAGNPGVFHYVCPKGCAGGSGAAGTCSKCGSELAHNAAFHNN